MRLPRKLLLLVSMVGVFSMLGAGVAFADHTGGTEWTCDDEANAPEGESCGGPTNSQDLIGPAAQHAFAPVGSNIISPSAPGNPGSVNGFQNPNSSAGDGINHNPLCPFHGVEPTP
jgi:hypothetical protein